MGRIGIWIANGALFVLCCFLVAGLINQVTAYVITPAPGQTLAAPPATQPSTRTPGARSAILERNLFNVSTVIDVPAVLTEDEQLEATKLPLKLLGTAASADSRVSWAAVEDLETRAHVVVRVNDTLKEKAKVVRIERRRIVLENGPRREELALDDEVNAGGGSTRRFQRTASRPPPSGLVALPEANRIRQLAENRFSVARTDVENVANNPAALFTQARILPKYENGKMVGVQLNAVKPGSLFEQIGIQSGDTITVFNGIEINSPEQSAQLLRQFTESKQFLVNVVGVDGQQRTLTYELRD